MTPPAPRRHAARDGVSHRVALVIGAQGWRGSATSFVKIAQGLTARGHQVQVVVDNERLARGFAAEGIATSTVAMPGTSLAVLRRFRRALSPVPDVMLVDGPRELRLAALATLGWRTRLVFRYNLLFRRMLRDVASRLFWTRIHAIVYQCEAIRRRALEESPWLGARMSVRIPNGYDVDHFRPDPSARAVVRERLGIAPDRLLVVTGGMPTKGKGHDTAVAALAAIRDALPFSWVVLGDGERREPTRALAVAAGLDAHFTGMLRPSAVAEMLAAADVVLHPATHEIFPNAVAEAMASGVAVVATDAGGTVEVIGDDGVAGVVVPVGDVPAMAAAVGGLLADAHGRSAMGAAARARIAAEFPVERMVAGYEQLVRTLGTPA